MHFCKLFEHESVLAVCIYNHPIMIKIHPVKGSSLHGRGGGGGEGGGGVSRTH